MIVEDRLGGIVTAMSGGTDNEDIDERRNEVLILNPEVLHVIYRYYFHAQKSFLGVVRSRWWVEDNSRDKALVRLKTAPLHVMLRFMTLETKDSISRCWGLVRLRMKKRIVL